MGTYSTQNKHSGELTLDVGAFEGVVDHHTLACLSLLSAVGCMAIADAKDNLRRGFRDSWLDNNPNRPSSFEFIMEIFGVDPARARREIVKSAPYIPKPVPYTPAEDERLNVLLENAFGKGKK